eukprot:scaffold44944_cov41-Tisochrysis_lutea.AAC.1
MPHSRLALLPLLLSLPASLSFSPAGGDAFAIFGNAHTKVLIKQWSPKPLGVSTGSVMLPASTENMQRFVRARILLEDPSVGCVASAGGDDAGISLILTKFTGAEHQLLMPLWQPNTKASATFRKLADWHKERLSHRLLSGAHIERPEDRKAWAEADHLP